MTIIATGTTGVISFGLSSRNGTIKAPGVKTQIRTKEQEETEQEGLKHGSEDEKNHRL